MNELTLAVVCFACFASGMGVMALAFAITDDRIRHNEHFRSRTDRDPGIRGH